jgi:hypothetical protein
MERLDKFLFLVGAIKRRSRLGLFQMPSDVFGRPAYNLSVLRTTIHVRGFGGPKNCVRLGCIPKLNII